MTGNQELFSFMTKFLNLLHSGKSAQLLFECENGHAMVKLQHTLGKCEPPQEEHRRVQRHQGPSRLRRRARRAEARAAAAADQAGDSDNAAVMAEKQGELAVKKTADTNENVEKPTAVKAQAILPSQVAAAEAEPPVLQPSQDQKFRSAPPVTAAARSAPPAPGSLPPPDPPGTKKQTYMDKEKQRWTNLFGT